MKLTTQLLSLGSQLRTIEWNPASFVLDIALDGVSFQEKPVNRAFGIFPKVFFLDNCLALAKNRQIVHLTFLITPQSPKESGIILSIFPGKRPNLLEWTHLVKMTLGFLKPPTFHTTPQKLLEKYLLVHILSLKKEGQDHEPSPETTILKKSVQLSFPRQIEPKESPDKEDENRACIEKVHKRPSEKLIEKIFKQIPQELLEKGSQAKEAPTTHVNMPIKVDIPFGMIVPYAGNRQNESYQEEEESRDTHEEPSSQEDGEKEAIE